MWEWRHFSRNWTWTTKLPCALGVKAFGPVVQYCLECWFSAEYHRSLTYGLHSKHKTIEHRMIHFTSVNLGWPCERRDALVSSWLEKGCFNFQAEKWPVFHFHSPHFPLSALNVYRKCMAGVITVAVLWGFLFLLRTKTVRTLWRHKHKGRVCIVSWFSAQ